MLNIEDIRGQFVWILSETKLRAFEVELFLKKNNKGKHWRSLTVLDGLKEIANSLNQDADTNKPQQAEIINSLILEEILNNEFPELKKEISLIFEESSQSLKLKNLNYLLTTFKNFSSTLRTQQNIDSVIKEIIDESGNTLEKKQKIEELIQLSNYLNLELKERNIIDDIVSLDNLLLDLNTSKKTNLKLPELIMIDEASSYSRLELEILCQISKHSKVELLVKEPFLQIAELHKKSSFKELLSALPPSKKHFCSLFYNINRYGNQLSFQEVKNYNDNAEKLIGYLFDAQPLENNDYEFKLPFAIWKNKTPREEVTRLAKSLSFILKNNLASPDQIHLICLDLEEYQSLFEEIFTTYQIPFIIPRGKRLSNTTLGNFYLSYLSWFFKPTLNSLEKLCSEQLFDLKDFDKQAILNFINYCKSQGQNNDLFSESSWETYFLNVDPKTLQAITWIKSELVENSQLLKNSEESFPHKIFKKLNCFRFKLKKESQQQFLTNERIFLAATVKNTKNILNESFNFENSCFQSLGIEKSIFIENFILEKLKSEFLPLAYLEGNIIISEILDSRGLPGKLNFVLAASSENFPAKNLKQQFTNEYDELNYKIQETTGANSSIYESYSLIANLLGNSRELVFSFSCLAKNKETKPADFLQLLSKLIKENKNLSAPKILKDYTVEPPKKLNNNHYLQKSIEQLLSKKTNSFTAYDSFIGAQSSSEEIIRQLNKRFLRYPMDNQQTIAHYSVSSLETFADCPQKFFFSCLLGLKEDVTELSKTLAIETGNIVHLCLKKIFSQEQYKLITSENFDAACQELLKIAGTEFQNSLYDWELNYKWRQAKNLIIQGLDQPGNSSKRGYLKAALFYNKELIQSIPYQLEWNFGQSSAATTLKIIENNTEIRVLGNIDRIDRTAATEDSEIAAIWDYKTGAITPYNKVEKGKSLQIPLYALAVKQNIAPHNFPKRGAIFSLKQTNRNDEDVASFHKGVLIEHLAISRKGSRLIEDFTAVEKQCQNAKENVLKLDAALKAGEFQQKLDTEGCSYCEFKNICQRDETLIQIKSNKQEIIKESIRIEDIIPQFLEYEKNNKELLELSPEQEAACEINDNIALIAAAGSGKTTVLIRRILKLILAGESILSIVAITFTEKAAEEIKQRLSLAINTILEYNSLTKEQITPEQREFLVTAKSLLTLAPIGTIHSFAGILLGLDPLASKNPFSLKITSGEEQKKIAKTAIEKVLKENPKNLLIKLLNFGLSWRNIESRIYHLILFPRELFALNNTYQDLTFLKSILEKLNPGPGNSELNEQGVEIAKGFCELADYAYQRYLELKKEEAVLDFEDLIISAKECVSSNSKRANILKQRATKLFRHFLIDEFQDTDSYQWEIIKNIASEIFSEKKTKLAGNLKQTILIVGDPQQAIYGFRGGDSSIFRQAISEFQAVGGKLLFLRNNYRSEENLINFYNSYFSELFSCDFFEDNSSRVSTAITYEEMYALEKSTENKTKNVSFLVKDPESQIEEAAYLASFLKRYLTENPAADNIAILCRKNDHLQEIANELDLQNISYQITQSNRTLELNEIKQLENLLKYLNNPRDSIALVGLLRSTIFGFNDHDLFLFYQELNYSWEIKVELIKKQMFFDTAKKLAHWKNLNKYLSVSNLLKYILQEQNLEDIYRHANADSAYRNITMFIDTLSREEKSALVGPAISDVLNWLELKRSSNFQFPTQTANHKISLMTIHNAKGLEFDLVILAYIDYRLPAEHDFVIGEYATNKLLGIKVEDDEDSFTRAKTSLQNLIEVSSTALTCAEERRLFYVACTRAKKHLLFSFDQKKGFLGNQKKIKELSLTNRKANVFLKSNPYYWFEQLLDYESPSFSLANPLKRLNLPIIKI